MPKYAIIGWGSLIWDLDTLAPHVDGGWHIDHGPELPLEFVRVSPKRKNGLTVVIDHDHGERCRSSIIASRRSSGAMARSDLADRERAPLDKIGMIDRQSGIVRSRSKKVVRIVSHWLKDNGFTGAVWTDLERNFEEKLKRPFSVPAAVAYLDSLRGESLVEAKRYIENAPRAVDTPLRRALTTKGWF